ncbi:MAG: ATP-binding cassette domain-containing protein [Solirubrobacteraceae bacterium]
MSEPLLEARGLAARRGGREVLRGVDLELRAGEVLAILGPNGAGKSTLLAALAGLLPAAAGSVERRARVATALQGSALADRSARANVEAALRWWGVPRAERRERAEAALAALGAGHLAARRAIELSGGEARRVHLARALALEAGVLLLDEPFAGLDAPARADLLEDAGAALAHPERAVAVVLHDRAEAWALADRVLVLLDGRPAAAGATREVLEQPPAPDVAGFLGFTGWLAQAGGVRMLRPSHVTLDPAGDVAATVVRRIPVEEGFRLELELPGGRLQAPAPLDAPGPGEVVRLRLAGGVEFPHT